MITQTLLYLHVVAGTAALLSGGVAAIAEKGKDTHIRSGRVFALAMAVTALSAILLSLLRPNPFLLGIGFFTAYLTASGWIWMRRIPLMLRVRYARRIAYGGFATAAYMLFETFAYKQVNVILLVFALILLIMATPDIFRRKNPKSPVTLHGARMGGAYIAALTAFIVVNIDFGIWGWLAPSAVGSPLIALSIRRFSTKKGKPVVKTVPKK